MGDKIVESKNLCCQPVVFPSLSLLRAAEKNKEKVEANCTGFSAEFFGSHSVEMFCFARKTKVQMLTTYSRSLTRIH